MWKTPGDVKNDAFISLSYTNFQSCSTICVSVGDWVIVSYDGAHYPGEVTDKRGKDIEVNVMVPASNNKWKWPAIPDKIFYKPENIVQKIAPPEAPCAGQSRLQFTFSVKIQRLFLCMDYCIFKVKEMFVKLNYSILGRFIVQSVGLTKGLFVVLIAADGDVKEVFLFFIRI